MVDNIATSAVGERHHNVLRRSAGSGDSIGTPLFTGGANPTAYTSYVLAAGSPPGKDAASDGDDAGIARLSVGPLRSGPSGRSSSSRRRIAARAHVPERRAFQPTYQGAASSASHVRGPTRAWTAPGDEREHQGRQRDAEHRGERPRPGERGQGLQR